MTYSKINEIGGALLRLCVVPILVLLNLYDTEKISLFSQTFLSVTNLTLVYLEFGIFL